MKDALEQWTSRAAAAVADKGESVDGVQSGQADGIASINEIGAALAAGVFDQDTRKADVERLVNSPAVLHAIQQANSIDASGAEGLRLQDWQAYRAAFAQSAALQDAPAQAASGVDASQRDAWAKLAETFSASAAASAAAAASTPTPTPPAATAPDAPPADAVSQTPAADTPAAPTGAAQMRTQVLENFGFLDGAAEGSSRDGYVTIADLQAAAASRMLRADVQPALAKLAADSVTFGNFDARDGVRDGKISFTALEKADGANDKDQYVAESWVEVPDVRVAHYSAEFFALQNSISAAAADPQGQPAQPPGALAVANPDEYLAQDKAAFNALDAMDGSQDGKLNAAGLRLYGIDTKDQLFNATANDGSGRSVFEAALSSLADDFAATARAPLPEGLDNDRQRAYRLALALWDNQAKIGSAPAQQGQPRVFTLDDLRAAQSSDSISAQDRAYLNELVNDPTAWNWLANLKNDGSGNVDLEALHGLVTEFNKVNFNGIMMAAGAVANGIPMKTAPNSGAQFPDDMTAEFCAGQVFDPAAAEIAYNRLMGDPSIQDALTEKIRAFTPNGAVEARRLYNEIISPYYSDSLSYLENLPDGKTLSEQKVAVDLAALMTLDKNLGEQAATVLLQRKFIAEIDNSTPSSVPPDQMMLATRDLLTTVALDLRAVRGGVRLPGLLAGHDAGWAKIRDAFAFIKDWPVEKVNQLADLLSQSFVNADRANGGRGMPTAQQVISQAEGSADALLKQVNAATNAVERSRLGGMWEGLVQQVKNIKRVAGLLEKHGAWASLAGGVSVAGGIYKLVQGGDTLGQTAWGRLSVANDFVLAVCFIPGYANSANWLMSKMGYSWDLSTYGLAPQQSFGKLVRAFYSGNPASVNTDMAGVATGAALRGLTGASLVAAGAIGGAMGIQQLISGINSGEKYDVAGGSLNIAMGASWAASGVTYLLSSTLTGPLIGIGALFGVVSVLLTIFGPKPENQFARDFESKLGEFGESGVLREGWSDAVKTWFKESQNLPPGTKPAGYTGMGMDM